MRNINIIILLRLKFLYECYHIECMKCCNISFKRFNNIQYFNLFYLLVSRMTSKERNMISFSFPCLYPKCLYSKHLWFWSKCVVQGWFSLSVIYSKIDLNWFSTLNTGPHRHTPLSGCFK